MRSHLRVALWLAGWIGALAVGQAASPPSWLKPFRDADTSTLAKGQAAVQLVNSATVQYLADDRVRRVCRGAIRVLSADGQKAATCAYDYDSGTGKLISARGWIVSSDGQRTEILSTSRFLDTARRVGNFFSPQHRVVTCSAPSTEVGGVFAWEFEVESQTGIFDVNWSFTSQLPLHRSILEVVPPPGGELEWRVTDARIGEPTKGASPGAWRWEVRDVPATTGDAPDRFLPALRSISVRSIVPGRASAVAQWSDVARTTAEIIEPRIVVSPEIVATAQGLVRGRSARWERIRAVTEFVQKEIAYLSIAMEKDYLAGCRPHLAPEVLRNRYGDCKDKVALLVALLRALGEEAMPVLLVSGDPRAVRRDWPSASFNHVIAAIAADDAVPAAWPLVEAGPHGRMVLFDPTDSTTPLGLLSAGDQGGCGLIASPQTTELIVLPTAAPETNSYQVTLRAEMDTSGSMTVRVDESATGTLGAGLHAEREGSRQRYAELLESRLHETIPLLRNFEWSDGWNVTAAQWNRKVQFEAVHYGREMPGHLLLVNPQMVGIRGRLSAWKTTAEGVALSLPAHVKKQARFELPVGSVIVELPDDWNQQLPSAEGTVRYRKDANAIICDYALTQRGGLLNKQEYEALRVFVQKLQDAERRPILVRCPAPAATN